MDEKQERSNIPQNIGNQPLPTRLSRRIRLTALTAVLGISAVLDDTYKQSNDYKPKKS